jgi:hypothetical protein
MLAVTEMKNVVGSLPAHHMCGRGRKAFFFKKK